MSTTRQLLVASASHQGSSSQAAKLAFDLLFRDCTCVGQEWRRALLSDHTVLPARPQRRWDMLRIWPIHELLAGSEG